MQKMGKLSIHTENMLPIIKRWLYSDRDIFIRELISNACDAITKHRKITDAPRDYAVTVTVDAAAGTLSFEDNGIGMDAQETEKYLGQVAFSGAEDFLKNYQQAGEANIIGHFGLGFYSAFMVAERVTVDTMRGGEAVRWESDGAAEYTLSPSERAEEGTLITLKLAGDAAEFLQMDAVRAALKKYCAFLPPPIFLRGAGGEPERVNGQEPLFLKQPRECTDEQYKAFYTSTFNVFEEPLFWIHLNVDYPFNLKGILYFPRIKNQYDALEGVIKLYNNQVFVADNIKELIPDFMLLLRGVLDFPDLPLNVSRSALQNDGTVRKIQAHITKKAADKLTALFEGERAVYEGYWDDIAPFVRYGCLRDDKFYDAVSETLLYKTVAGRCVTLKEFLGGEEKVYYATDPVKQARYIDLYKAQALDALLLTGPVDPMFIDFLERKNEKLSFARIDSEVASQLKAEGELTASEALVKLFREAAGKEQLTVSMARLKAEELPAMLLAEEKSRRFGEMAAQYGVSGVHTEYTLVLNAEDPVIQKLDRLPEEKARLIASQIYSVALMNVRALTGEEYAEFNRREHRLLAMLAQE